MSYATRAAQTSMRARLRYGCGEIQKGHLWYDEGGVDLLLSLRKLDRSIDQSVRACLVVRAVVTVLATRWNRSKEVGRNCRL